MTQPGIERTRERLQLLGIIAEVEKRATEAEVLAQSRLEVLQAVEWGPTHAGRCPLCFNLKTYGHAADCRLKAALG